MIDLAAVRRDTPACDTLAHFNNAGASLIPDPVHQAVLDHLSLEREIGGYEAVAASTARINAFYQEFAALLRADPSEIAFTENATRAWDMAFYGLPLKEGDRILTHASEYASNYLAFMQQAKRRGLEIDHIPSDASGQIDVEAIPALITPQTKLIAITHAPSQSGLINPAAAVGKVARDYGLLYMLDACQSVGQLDVDVSEIGCHILSGTGRKFLRGPRGTGFLYVSGTILEQMDPPFIDLHAATWTDDAAYELAAGARRFEAWEGHIAGKIGLAAAVRYARGLGLKNIEARVKHLAAYLRTRLAAIKGVTVRDLGRDKSGIVTFTRDGESGDAVKARLTAAAINVSVTPMTYARLDLAKRNIPAVIRASVHYYNTEEEIDRLIQALSSTA